MSKSSRLDGASRSAWISWAIGTVSMMFDYDYLQIGRQEGWLTDVKKDKSALSEKLIILPCPPIHTHSYSQLTSLLEC